MIPEDKRLAVVAFPLSAEQQEHFSRSSGLTVSEALVAGIVDKDAPLLDNEITGDEAEKLAEKIWEGNQRFITNLEAKPGANGAFTAHTGHEIERDVPNYLFLR